MDPEQYLRITSRSTVVRILGRLRLGQNLSGERCVAVPTPNGWTATLGLLTIAGPERLDALQGPCIIIANHQSHLDSLVLFTALPEKIKSNLYFGAAQDRWCVKGKAKLELQPWYQSLVYGNFPIVRGGVSNALDLARWLLQQGCNVAIFPEGTRATSDRLGDFQHGVARLALECDVPVVPVYVDGLRALRSKERKHASPGPAHVEILGPIRFGDGMQEPEVTQTLWAMMNARHRHHQELAHPL